MTLYPRAVILISGKRKSGKDYFAEHLNTSLGKELSVIIRISAPIKKEYSDSHGLNYDLLLSSSVYKESYRLDMIKWSECKRKEDHGIFIKAAMELFKGVKYPVWIVSDMRRKTDLNWFKFHYLKDKIITVRINASDETRSQRGWVFQTGIDDAESECDLDDMSNWNFVINNDSGKPLDSLQQIVALCNKLILTNNGLQ